MSSYTTSLKSKTNFQRPFLYQNSYGTPDTYQYLEPSAQQKEKEGRLIAEKSAELLKNYAIIVLLLEIGVACVVLLYQKIIAADFRAFCKKTLYIQYGECVGKSSHERNEQREYSLTLKTNGGDLVRDFPVSLFIYDDLDFGNKVVLLSYSPDGETEKVLRFDANLCKNTDEPPVGVEDRAGQA